jgi:hypothetical protein
MLLALADRRRAIADTACLRTHRQFKFQAG